MNKRFNPHNTLTNLFNDEWAEEIIKRGISVEQFVAEKNIRNINNDDLIKDLKKMVYRKKHHYK